MLCTSRFSLERDDEKATHDRYGPTNVQVDELLNRRVDVQDVFNAQLCAIDHAAQVGFGRHMVSATSPFTLRVSLPSYSSPGGP